ncbi:FeoA domain-containing protein [Sedimenticola selenatireducens]|uniref:Ferrous iron transport protein A n=1 Tax=Sedimenticola selenatireducens TaxID=191960 RepID=A0A2N6CTR7_9GAMM|nr:FeoA domain-containing protein [Sedimenticola selenatireducens]PLX60563.1 MAG: ferrous iron transport protein A [Sedimenticola selenatireducens]
MDAAVAADNIVTLDHVPTWAQARITRIQGDKGLARRLLGLGLRVGSEITVLQQRRRGVVVASAGTRVALGSSVADKLLMQPLDQ